jgi:hypothetical protein
MSEKYTFKAKDFYRLLEEQKYRCPITGRELTPETTCAEHIVPLRKGEVHELKSIYLVDQMASRLKRHYTEEEILQFAIDVVNALGDENGSGTISFVSGQRKGKKP